jgi:two-component system chemotaxis sensor kinase CheA
MAAIRDTFFLECEEQLAELESGLMALEAGEENPDTINAVFRAVHSIKGGAGAFALDALVAYSHVFETTLDAMRSGKRDADRAALKVMLRAADVLADLVRAARHGTSVDAQRVQTISAELTALCGDAADTGADDLDDLVFTPVQATVPEAPAQIPAWTIRFAPRPELFANGNDASLLLRELSQLGELDVRLDCSALPPLETMDADGAWLAWDIVLHGDIAESQIRDVFDFVDTDCTLEVARQSAAPSAASAPADPSDNAFADLMRSLAATEAPPVAAPAAEAAAPPPPPAAPRSPAEAEPAAKTEAASAGTTIRVDLNRVDRMIDLVGELVINEAMLSQQVLEAGVARTSGVASALDELASLTREIQDSVMAIRAQPVRSVFQRIPRLVREVAAMTGKTVTLVTEGEGTEVDKTVIERLSDPLTHMIRNAIDHGIEAPEVRAAKGKPETGTVRLAALHRSGRIVIEVADDGAGIDRARVKAKAVQRGIISAEAAMTDDEIDNLIFMPGFSTADTVSNISGRGVGMDVVKRSVQALGGRIAIASRPGQGSTFTLSLPLTLAVLDGMVVGVAGHTLIVPIAAVIETLQPSAKDLHGVGMDVRLIALRGAFIPLLDVADALGYTRQAQQDERSVAMLVEGEGGRRAVLLVDAIMGQRQVVIKSLEANYRAIPGIAAATVMGDGRVALILDVDALLADMRFDARCEPAWADIQHSEQILEAVD